MRSVVTALFTFVALSSVALASQPGQPMDCTDWTDLAPGITCRDVLRCETWGNEWMDTRCQWGGSDSQLDNEGAIFYLRYRTTGVPIQCEGGVLPGVVFDLVRLRNGSEEVFGTFPSERCGVHPDTYESYRPPAVGTGRGIMAFDPLGGRLVMMLDWNCTAFPGHEPSTGKCQYGYPGPWVGLGEREIVAIGGFTTLFDVIDSYVPTPSNFGFRVPHRPDGLRAADRFDTYTGEVTRPLDLSQAQPLQCSYPASPPSAGDYLTFPASGTPAPGHARYFLTAVTHQGQTRAGRQTIEGTLRGRDASVLPACIVATEGKP